MAIKFKTQTAHGVKLLNAYVRITFYSGDNKHVQYHVRTWATAQARKDEKQHLDEKNYSFEYAPGQGDVLVACYQDLMARPEYAGALAV